MQPSPDLCRTSAYWDEMARQHLGSGANTNRAEWQGHPLCAGRRVQLQGGMGLSEWLVSRLPGPVESALSVGCGQASLELDLLASGAVGRFDLYDVSNASLDRARERSRELGVADRATFHCRDMGSVDGADYDLITFVSSLHHALDVPATVERAKSLLKPGGLLFADEYIGPDRFGFPDQHLTVPRALYRCLAGHLRGPWPELPIPDPVEVQRADPTEAAQSGRILESLNRVFDCVDVTPLFGALPFMTWWGLDHNALWELPDGFELVQLLLDLDEALCTSGRLPTYFALILATKSPSPTTVSIRP